MKTHPQDDIESVSPAAVNALERIAQALRGLRFGTVTAVVHDGVVVQVERTQKIRLDRRDTP
jgi:hypothetical protein